MKKILFLILLFLILLFIGTNYAQINRSNWNSAKIDAWAIPPGGVILNGVDQYYSIPDNANLDFGVGSFAVGLYLKANVQEITTILSKFLNLQILTSATTISLKLYDGVDSYEQKITYVVTKDTQIYMVVDGRISAKIYIDGLLKAPSSVTGTLADIGSINNTSAIEVGRRSTLYFDGYIYNVKFHNHALTAEEVTAAWNNGEPWKVKTEYKHKGAKQTVLTSGTLKIGKEYIIDAFVAGDDFDHTGITIVSGTINTTGCVFIPAETTPTTWTNSSSLRRQGEVLNIPFNRWGTNGAIDISGNELHANSSGSPIAVMGDWDVRTTVSTTEVELVNTQKAGYRLIGVDAFEKSGSANTFYIGTATGVYDIANATAISANSSKFTSINQTALTERSLFIKAGASSITFILQYEKVQ